MNPSGVDGTRYVEYIGAQRVNLQFAILAVNLVDAPNHYLPASCVFVGECRHGNAQAKVGVLGEVERVNLVHRPDDVRAGASPVLNRVQDALRNRLVVLAWGQWDVLAASECRQQGRTRSRP